MLLPGSAPCLIHFGSLNPLFLMVDISKAYLRKFAYWQKGKRFYGVRSCGIAIAYLHGHNNFAADRRNIYPNM